MISRSYSWPDGHWDWYQHLAFKHGIRVGELAFVGGQVDKTDKGEPLNAYDLPRQTAAVVRHINTVLQGFGGSIEQVTKLVAFYSNDGSVDERAFLADVGRCFPECAGKDFAGVGPVITPVPLPCLALPGMMVEIEAIALLPANGNVLARHTANPGGLPPLPTPFSHGLRAGPHIWVGAQSPADADGAIQQAGDPVGQTGIVMDNLLKVLDELEVELSDVLKVGCWFDGDGTSATWEPGALERAEHFESPGPVVTELPSPCLPAGETARVEAWAMRGIDGKPLQRDSANSQSWQWPHPLPYSSAVRCEDLVFSVVICHSMQTAPSSIPVISTARPARSWKTPGPLCKPSGSTSITWSSRRASFLAKAESQGHRHQSNLALVFLQRAGRRLHRCPDAPLRPGRHPGNRRNHRHALTPKKQKKGDGGIKLY